MHRREVWAKTDRRTARCFAQKVALEERDSTELRRCRCLAKNITLRTSATHSSPASGVSCTQFTLFEPAYRVPRIFCILFKCRTCDMFFEFKIRISSDTIVAEMFSKKDTIRLSIEFNISLSIPQYPEVRVGVNTPKKHLVHLSRESPICCWEWVNGYYFAIGRTQEGQYTCAIRYARRRNKKTKNTRRRENATVRLVWRDAKTTGTDRLLRQFGVRQ